MRVSQSDFSFVGRSGISPLSELADVFPESAFGRLKAEQAYHNAFKALEALIGGEPSRDDRKFRERLLAIGIDPDSVDQCSVPGETLMDILKRIRQTRDARAAHAGRTKASTREIAYSELNEAQRAIASAIAQAVLHAAEASSS